MNTSWDVHITEHVKEGINSSDCRFCQFEKVDRHTAKVRSSYRPG